jgi:hypothetical protein
MLSISIWKQPQTVTPHYLDQILGFWVTCHLWSQHDVILYNTVEADSHLKLLPPSILDIYKVFVHIDMLSMSIR